MIKKNNSINYFIILLLLAFIFFDYKFASLNNQHLSWDEVNYSKASSLGFLENAFELKSKNIFEFIKLGYNKIYVKKNLPIIADLNIINQEKPEDIFELRHYHPPLYIYYLSLFHSIEISDYDLRLAHKIIGYFIIAVLFLCCLLINKNNNDFLINFLCLITLIIFFYSDLFQKSLKNLNFHSLFSLTIILFSYSFYKYVLKSNLKNSIRLSVSISIMFISLETAIFIFLSSISYIFFYKKNILLNKNFLYLLIAAFLISLILWPANFYNITIFKTYLMYVYRIFFVSGIEYSDLNIFLFLIDIFTNNYFLILIFILALLLFLKDNLLNKKLFGLFLFNSVTYFLILINFSHHTNYIFPAFVMLFFFITIIILKNTFLKNIKFFSVLLIIFLFFFINNILINFNIKQKNLINNDHFFLINEFLNKNVNNNQIIFSDDAHILNYYNKSYNILTLNLYDKYDPKFYYKFDDNYYDLTNMINDNQINCFIINKSRNFKKEQYDYLIKKGYTKLDFSKYYIFNLSDNS